MEGPHQAGSRLPLTPSEIRSMHEAVEPSLLGEGVLLLGFALGFVLLFRRLGLGATLGYLLAGIVVGPQVLGLAGDAPAKMGIAELGITLLLFVVGLELNPSRLWRMKQRNPGASACCRWSPAGWRWPGIIAAMRLSRPARRSRSACRSRCRPPRRCCRCCVQLRAAAHAVRRARLRDPAVPGSLDHSAHHHHRRHEPQSRPDAGGPPGWHARRSGPLAAIGRAGRGRDASLIPPFCSA
jgi:hypothetical protein